MISYFKYTTILLMLGCRILLSQSSETLQTFQPELRKEGIYINCQSFIANQPIVKNRIKSDLNLNDAEFYGKVLSKPKIYYADGDGEKTLNSDSVWGFVQNGTIYVNVQGSFYRVPVFGRISYFVAMIEVNQFIGGGFDPVTGMPMRGSVKTREMREFILLFDAGCGPFAFDLEKIEMELKKDEDVWKEYESEKRKNRRKYITRYIRKYNSRNPL